MKKKKFQIGESSSGERRSDRSSESAANWPIGEERSLRSRNTRAHEIRRTRKERDLRDSRAHARHGEPSPVELDPPAGHNFLSRRAACDFSGASLVSTIRNRYAAPRRAE